MPHPNGGKGSWFNPKHSFTEAYVFVGDKGVNFRSTTDELIQARQGFARDGATPTIVVIGERNRHGSACKACWGFRVDCNQSRIGQCAEALDYTIKKTSFQTKNSIESSALTSGSKSRKQDPSPSDNSVVSADELARIRRSLLRLLDVIDQGTKSSDGPAVRIARPSRSDKIPREIAALMRVITEMRNASEYQDKQLSDSESFALRSSWNAILEWTAKKNITFKQ